MYRHTAPKYASLCLVVICIVVTSILFACSSSGSGNDAQQPGTGGTGGTGTMPPGTGGVSFQLIWQNSSGTTGIKGAKPTPSFNSCVDYAIQTVVTTVSNPTATVTSVSWPCSAHKGLIVGIPAGTNYRIQVNGLSSGPTATLWSGATTTITVYSDQITNAGTVVMSYTGGDITTPIVTSIGPHSNPTSNTNVPVTDRIDIPFSEPMAISTITSTNTLLTVSNTPVPGTVIYDRASNTGAFVSSTPLAYSTEYVLQIISCVTPSSCITDNAGNSLASDYTYTFTTESAPIGAPPVAPSGVTANPGNGQVTLDWLATSGSTSYNIYWLTSPGVTTSNGNLISNVRPPAIHLGLNNSQTYYYIATAVNIDGESPASSEVSATPVFPAGTPLPPAFSSAGVTFNGTQNTITWSPVSGATAYNLYWSMRPIIPDRTAADNVIRYVTSPYTHMGLTSGQNYCYIVTAMDSSGESADSTQVCGPGGSGSIQIIWP